MLECTIYFIRCPILKAIKIGQAGQPHKRLAEMQVGCPAELKMHGLFHAEKGTEARLHAKFKSQRIRGEWFTETPEMLAEIAELIANGMPPAPKQTKEQREEWERFVRELYAPVDTIDF